MAQPVVPHSPRVLRCLPPFASRSSPAFLPSPFVPLSPKVNISRHYHPASRPVRKPILTLRILKPTNCLRLLPLTPESRRRTHSGLMPVYFFLIRWRAKKLAKRADHQVSQTRQLLDTRGAEMEPGDRNVIQERLLQ